MAVSPAAQKILDAHKKDFEAAKNARLIDEANSSNAIDILQRRVATQFFPIELPGGDVIKIRTEISKAEAQQIDALREEQSSLDVLDPKVQEAIDLLSVELMGIQMNTPSKFKRVREISNEIESLREKSPETIERSKHIDYEIIEIIVADDGLTAKWLCENEDKFSQETLLWVLNGFFEQRVKHAKDRQERIASITSFR